MTERFIAVKKFVASLAVLPLAFGLAACGSNSSEQGAASGESGDPITIGVVGADAVHDAFVEEAKAEGIEVEIQDLSDYNQPNPALENGDIDINWFQHIDYLANYNNSNGGDIAVLGGTEIYPLGLYSEKYDSVDQIGEGETIAIPNDPTNSVRALLVLEGNDLISFKDPNVQYPTVDDIDTENSKVEVVAVDATQAALSLGENAGSVINNDFLADAGLEATDAIAVDDASSDAAKKYANVFAVQPEDLDNETYKKLVEVFHSDAVQQAVSDNTQGTAIEVNDSQEELNKILDETEKALQEQQ